MPQQITLPPGSIHCIISGSETLPSYVKVELMLARSISESGSSSSGRLSEGGLIDIIVVVTVVVVVVTVVKARI